MKFRPLSGRSVIWLPVTTSLIPDVAVSATIRGRGAYFYETVCRLVPPGASEKSRLTTCAVCNTTSLMFF